VEATTTLLSTRVDDAGLQSGEDATFVEGNRLLRRPPIVSTVSLAFDVAEIRPLVFPSHTPANGMTAISPHSRPACRPACLDACRRFRHSTSCIRVVSRPVRAGGSC
jgi:hypothetical protein